MGTTDYWLERQVKSQSVSTASLPATLHSMVSKVHYIYIYIYIRIYVPVNVFVYTIYVYVAKFIKEYTKY